MVSSSNSKIFVGFLWLSIFIIKLFTFTDLWAGEIPVFGPEDYERSRGAPTQFLATFETTHPNATYLLRVINGGVDEALQPVTSGEIAVNGETIFGPADFHRRYETLERTIAVLPQNELAIELRGAPGSGLTLSVVGVDEDLPQIEAKTVPAANTAGWHNTVVTVFFTCSDTSTAIASCPKPITVREEGADQIIRGTAVDVAGNEQTIELNLNIDRTPPLLSLDSPLPASTNTSSLLVAGRVEDQHELLSLHLNEAPISFGNGDFAETVQLVDGPNPIALTALDVAGNRTTIRGEIERFSLPEIRFLSPSDRELLTEDVILVLGEVSDARAVVTLNGEPTFQDGETFAAEITLREGENLLNAVATLPTGRVGMATLSIFRDRSAPRLVVDHPAEGALVASSPLTVFGSLYDLAPASPDTVAPRVTVNGRPAEVSRGTFLIADLELASGHQEIEVVAIDGSGNEGRALRRVNVLPRQRDRIEAVSGSGQIAVIGEPLAEPLVARLIDRGGLPVAGVQVVFAARGNDGFFAENGERFLGVTTDGDGLARASFVAGTRAGLGQQLVTASAAGFVGSALFINSTRPAAPNYLINDSGDQQTGIADDFLPLPLVAVITDRGFNRLADVPVTFKVVQGGGGFAYGDAELTVFSDEMGRAVARFRLGPEEGIANNVVEATLPEHPSLPQASFVASGRVAGEASQTMVSGLVLDNVDQPVPGVTLRLAGSDLVTRADERGAFELRDVTPRFHHLLVEGDTAERPGIWPSLEFVLYVLPGQDNTLGRPIYLLPLDLTSGVAVSETRGGRVTLDDLPGFALDIEPGSVTFPDGSKSGLVSVTAVHADKIPMVPNFGQQPRLVVTIQPAGAYFDPPARLTLPNVDGLAPGEVTEQYSFDHDLGRFVSIGLATVSDDGAVIVSRPGFGVVKAGWHCGGNPAVVGTAHDCPQCQECIDNWCQVVDIGGVVCDDGDECTFNDRCVEDGRCIGDDVVVYSVDRSACVTTIGEPVVLTARSNASPLVQWKPPVGSTPASGTGSTFSVSFDSLGPKSVRAGCGSTQVTVVTVWRDCAGLGEPVVKEVVVPRPPPPGDAGHVAGIEQVSSFATCVDQQKFCFRLSEIVFYYAYGLNPRNRTDITGASDPNVTPGTCEAIIKDLTPVPVPGRTYMVAPYLHYIPMFIIEAHEQVHVQEIRKNVFEIVRKELSDFVRQPANCTDCPVIPSKDMFKQDARRIWNDAVREHRKTSEDNAYGVENQLLQILITEIRERARNAPASERWPSICK